MFCVKKFVKYYFLTFLWRFSVSKMLKNYKPVRFAAYAMP